VLGRPHSEPRSQTNHGDQQRRDRHPDAAHYPDGYTDPERETGHRSTDGTLEAQRIESISMQLSSKR
jgi:hypothetical protein